MGGREQDLRGKLRTTVVGSFPLSYTEENRRLAFEDQLKAGIDYPSPPQLKDMNLMFLEGLAEQGCGLVVRENEPWLITALRPPERPVAIADLVWALSFLKEKGLEKEIMGVKVPITGPITLSSVTKLSEDRRVLEYPQLVPYFAEVVGEIVRWFCEHNPAIVTIDEPALSYALKIGTPEDTILDAFEKTLAKVGKNIIKSIHVCGKIDRRLSELLLKTDALVLQHEFKAIPKNLDAYKKSDLEEHDKMLGLGCVQTAPDEKGSIPVETEKDVKKLVLQAGEKFGLENLMLSPDCGFKGLKDVFRDEKEAQEVALNKMLAMVKAAREIREEKLKV